MTTERIKEIQSKTAYPESASVQQALLQVWNEVAQKYETFNTKREMREILLEMYEKLWNADKDKFTWNAILKDTLEKLETFNIKEK